MKVTIVVPRRIIEDLQARQDDPDCTRLWSEMNEADVMDSVFRKIARIKKWTKT